MTKEEFDGCRAGGFLGMYVGTFGNARLRVKLSLWTKSGIRVKFLDGESAGTEWAWQTVHPDDVRPTRRLW